MQCVAAGPERKHSRPFNQALRQLEEALLSANSTLFVDATPVLFFCATAIVASLTDGRRDQARRSP